MTQGTDPIHPLDWHDTHTPVSRRFDDPFFSLQDGLAETQHVFLAGNDLPERLRPGFHIAELGFGTGLNLLAAWAMFRTTGLSGQLNFTSFEAFPMSAPDIMRAQAAFPALAPLAATLAPFWAKGATRIDLPDLKVNLVYGDARQTVPAWSGRADAWFLDGFAPAKNPELWEPALLQAVHDHSASFATAATYTAAGAVRRALEAAGFAVTRVQGFGRKRHMTRAVRSE